MKIKMNIVNIVRAEPGHLFNECITKKTFSAEFFGQIDYNYLILT